MNNVLLADTLKIFENEIIIPTCSAVYSKKYDKLIMLTLVSNYFMKCFKLIQLYNRISTFIEKLGIEIIF